MFVKFRSLLQILNVLFCLQGSWPCGAITSHRGCVCQVMEVPNTNLQVKVRWPDGGGSSAFDADTLQRRPVDEWTRAVQVS